MAKCAKSSGGAYATMWTTAKRHDGTWVVVRCPVEDKCPWESKDVRRWVEIAHGTSLREAMTNFEKTAEFKTFKPSKTVTGVSYFGRFPWDFSKPAK